MLAGAKMGHGVLLVGSDKWSRGGAGRRGVRATEAMRTSMTVVRLLILGLQTLEDVLTPFEPVGVIFRRLGDGISATFVTTPIFVIVFRPSQELVLNDTDP